jgi:hypothetical protein
MGDASHRDRLPVQAVDHAGVGVRDDLDGDEPVDALLVGQVDDPHLTPAQLAQHPESVDDGFEHWLPPPLVAEPGVPILTA